MGSYEILKPLGAGGMGEVYRARDTKLDREVAIKILPDALALDRDRLARFEREAKVLASLNHPNIAQIYGLEDRALVMELVAGETLKGTLPPQPDHFSEMPTMRSCCFRERRFTEKLRIGSIRDANDFPFLICELRA